MTLPCFPESCFKCIIFKRIVRFNTYHTTVEGYSIDCMISFENKDKCPCPGCLVTIMCCDSCPDFKDLLPFALKHNSARSSVTYFRKMNFDCGWGVILGNNP